MPTYAKSEDWLHQSALLLQARPATTRITTRYRLKPARREAKPPRTSSTTEQSQSTPQPQTRPQTRSQQKQAQPQPQPTDDKEGTKPPRGHLILKTYDPVSGATLKYKTSKAAEVSRLVQMLGTLSRRMAGVESPADTAAEDVVMGEAPAVPGAGAGAGSEGEGTGPGTPVVSTPAGAGAGAGTGASASAGGAGAGGGGGKGKKKKGKR